MNPPIPMQWVGLIALPTLFTVMFAIGLMLGPAQVAAAMTRRTILLAVLFAAVVPLPMLTVVAVELFHLRGPIGVGLLLMAISPGAPSFTIAQSWPGARLRRLSQPSIHLPFSQSMKPSKLRSYQISPTVPRAFLGQRSTLFSWVLYVGAPSSVTRRFESSTP